MRHLLTLALWSLAFFVGAQIQWRNIRSDALGREVAYARLTTDPAAERIVYVTDGRKFMEQGLWAEIERLTIAGEVSTAHYVLVSSMGNRGVDHRNDYFFCNPAYFAFFREELLPTVEKNRRFDQSNRSLVGISFGGLNAAFFAAKGAPFGNYGLLSPVTYPRQSELNQCIAFGPREGLRFFVSTGRGDAENYVEILLKMYETKDFVVEVMRTEGAHDFDNWKEQLPQLLRFLSGE